MEIRKFCFKNLYGHISGKLNFKAGENFIVGINGCGKTTVLNFMRYLLGPSLPDLWTRYHEYAKVSFKHNQCIYTLTSTINKKNEHEMTLSREGEDFSPIVTSLILNPQNIASNSQRDEMAKEYQSFRPHPYEVETLQFLYELSEPVFIGLDREFQNRLIIEIQGQTGMDVGRPMRKPDIERSIESLVRNAFNSYKSEQIKLNAKLNEDILATSFSGIVRPENIEHRETMEIDKKIDYFEKKIMKYGDPNSDLHIETFSNETVRDAAEQFIKSLKVVIHDLSEENRVWYILNSHQFQRVESMVELFENYEHELLNKKRQVNLFVSNVSKFLLDSGKYIQLDDDTGDLYFLLSNGHNRLSISDLSSGEKQIVILFAYFAFSSLEGRPIIVDEPELSLHVHWQTMFMKAVKELLPASSQAIMATHSPEICGGENVNIQVMKVKK